MGKRLSAAWRRWRLNCAMQQHAKWKAILEMRLSLKEAMGWSAFYSDRKTLIHKLEAAAGEEAKWSEKVEQLMRSQ